jgi:PAS domain S-box-containing protein
VKPAPVPEDEAERLAALRDYEILDTLPEQRFEDLARVAATVCAVPIAWIAFIDEDRQWPKSCLGIDLDAVDREISFCAHAILEPDRQLVVEDLAEDPRFEDNPFVTGGPQLRFYAGTPLVTAEGHALGTLCVADRHPQSPTDEQLVALRTLADQVMVQLRERRRQRELVQESRFLQGVLDSLRDHVAILDHEGDIIATNEAWDRFAGATGSGDAGSNYLATTDEMDDEEATEVGQALQAILAGEREVYETTHARHGPEEERWFRTTATGFEERGEPRIVVAHREITEARHRQAELERLTAVVENAPQGIATATPDGDLLFVNDGWRDLLEVPDEETRSLDEVHTENARTRLREQVVPSLPDQGVWQGEMTVTAADGDEIPVLETLIWHGDAQDERTSLSVILGDLRPVKAARRAVEQSEEQFREIAQHVDEVFWAVTPDLEEARYVSPGFEAVFGRTRDTFYQNPRRIFEWIHPEDRARVQEALQGMEDDTQTVRYRIHRPDGAERVLESRGFAVRDEHGETVRITGMTRDITGESAERSEERRRAREAARNVELDQLVFATSHSLRTEVRRIRSYGQRLQQRAEGDLAATLREPVGEMLTGSRNLQVLHDALREYAEATRGDVAHGPVDLDDVAREVLAERSPDIEAGGGKAAVDELPRVHGDREQLRTLVAELVDNAIAFQDEPVRMELSTEDEGALVQVRVRDHGPGFDPEHAETVFGIFQQLDPDASEGAGIGLTIARRIVENHGGTIRAEPQPGEGLTVSFTLPKHDGGEPG